MAGWKPVTSLREGLEKTIVYFDDLFRRSDSAPGSAGSPDSGHARSRSSLHRGTHGILLLALGHARRENGEQDLLRSRIDAIIYMTGNRLAANGGCVWGGLHGRA